MRGWDKNMLEENGLILKSTRELKGKALEEVAIITRVKVEYLVALETGKLAAMPGRVYALGFASTYCKYLGVDDALLLADIKDYYYKNEVNNLGVDAIATEQLKTKSKKTLLPNGRMPRIAGSKSSMESEAIKVEDSFSTDKNAGAKQTNELRVAAFTSNAKKAISTRSTRFGGKFLWVILGIVIVLSLVLLLFLQGGSDSDLESDVPPISGVVSDESSDKLPISEMDENAVINVAITITAVDADCWVGVVIDEQYQSTGTIKAGDSITYEGTEKIWVRYNMASHVQVTHNGVDLGDFSGGTDVWNATYFEDEVTGEDGSVNADA